ncbi:RidA family protein, partial [Vibrio sp. S234-5]|uniref:RidA family protein n=1 Tax=Vibrio sp. S234-5 TaxID=1616781 RepID=UPI0005F0B027
MTVKRYGVEGGEGTGGDHFPFARAPETGGLLNGLGQNPMRGGGVVGGGSGHHCRLALQNCVDIMHEAGYTLEAVVHAKVILTDARYFQSFNKAFSEVFDAHPPGRIWRVCELVVDGKEEGDVTRYR